MSHYLSEEEANRLDIEGQTLDKIVDDIYLDPDKYSNP